MLAVIALIVWRNHAHIPQSQPVIKAACGKPRHTRGSAAPSASLSAIYQKYATLAGQDALRSRLEALARTDPSAALSWAGSVSHAQHRACFEEIVLQSVADSDPSKAVGLLSECGDEALRESPLLEQLVARWAMDDPRTALAWVRERQPGEARERLVGRCAFTMAATHPDDAARLVVEEMGTGPRQDEAAIAVLHQWALRYPASARAWVDHFPPSDLRTRAEDELANLPTEDTGHTN